MKKHSIFASLDHTAPHQPLLSEVKSFLALISAVLTVFLLGLLFASCEPIITNGSPQPASVGGSSGGGYCGLGTWGSTSVSSNQTVQGPAVIDGVYSVNGYSFAVGGTNKVGYIAVLEDTATYTITSSGTACQPITNTPSQSDVQAIINALVQDQRSNGCSGGCTVSRIQKFSNGNPDGPPFNQ